MVAAAAAVHVSQGISADALGFDVGHVSFGRMPIGNFVANQNQTRPTHIFTEMPTFPAVPLETLPPQPGQRLAFQPAGSRLRSAGADHESTHFTSVSSVFIVIGLHFSTRINVT